jgi:hypothetical protein
MLNEILTGQASLEGKPPPQSFPTGTEPAADVVCVGCRARYASSRGANGYCPTCVRVVEQALTRSVKPWENQVIAVI